MNWGEFAQILTAMAALCSVIASLRNGKKLKDIHIDINSRMTQMLEGARAEGGMKERENADRRDLITKEKDDGC